VSERNASSASSIGAPRTADSKSKYYTWSGEPSPELDRAEQLGIIAVNILAVTDLSLRFSDSLIRHRGGILNLGSLALSAGPWDGGVLCIQGLRPVIQRSAAPGTRSARSPRDDALSRFGIDGIQARAGLEPGFEHEILTVSALGVAQAGYRGLMANKRARAENCSLSAPAVSACVYSGGDRPRSAVKVQINIQAD
jgi:hypothetical protein